jgi:hypothetical protein
LLVFKGIGDKRSPVFTGRLFSHGFPPIDQSIDENHVAARCKDISSSSILSISN